MLPPSPNFALLFSAFPLLKYSSWSFFPLFLLSKTSSSVPCSPSRLFPPPPLHHHPPFFFPPFLPSFSYSPPTFFLSSCPLLSHSFPSLRSGSFLSLVSTLPASSKSTSSLGWSAHLTSTVPSFLLLNPSVLSSAAFSLPWPAHVLPKVLSCRLFSDVQDQIPVTNGGGM